MTNPEDSLSIQRQTDRKPLRAAIVGLGQIAQKLGHGEPIGNRLTHAGVLTRSPNTVLVGGCSPVANDRADFAETFDVPVFKTMEEMVAEVAPDLISICSPTSVHSEQLNFAIRAGVPRIWMEKPPAASLDEVRTLLALKHSMGGRTAVVVNFQRRYMAPYRYMRMLYADGRLGQCRQIAVTFSRGIEANGTHMADILSFVTGDKGNLSCQHVAEDWDFPGMVLTTDSGVPIFLSGVETPYHSLDIVATFDRARVSVLHGGMTFRSEAAVEHELFPGFERLSSQPDRTVGWAVERSFPRALADLLRPDVHARPPVSTMESALHGMALIDRMVGRQCAP